MISQLIWSIFLKSTLSFRRSTHSLLFLFSFVLFYCNKMEPLVTNRRCLIWLRVLPPEESSSRRQKIVHSIFFMMVLATLSFACLSSFTFCWKFVSIDLGRTMFSFMFVASEFAIIYTALVGMILMRHKIGAIFENLSTIYKASEYWIKIVCNQAFHFIFKKISHKISCID